MIKLPFIFGLLIGLSHFEGGLVTLFCQDRGRYQLLHILQPLSSGALISLALIHLIPLSVKQFSGASLVLVVSICALMILSEFGKPDKFLTLPPKWGQRFTALIYALGLGVLIVLGATDSFRLMILGTIVAIPTQFVQALRGFTYKRGYLDRRKFIETLFLASLTVPLTVLILLMIYPYLNQAIKGVLLPFVGGVFLFQGILEFQINHSYKSLSAKLLYFLAGIFMVCCL